MRSLLLLALVALGANACAQGGAAPPASAGFQRIAEIPRVGPGRWLPVVRPDEQHVSELEPDGSIRSIEHGLRLVRHPEGRVERAAELLPAGNASALELPRRFGGGFVFRIVVEGTTLLYRAPTWAGRLTPLVRLPFEAVELVAGFDRLHAVSARTRAVVGIDPASGSLLPEDPALPRAAAYGGLAFREGWVGVVVADILGALVTFDAGQSYHRGIPTQAPDVSEKNGRILLSLPEGTTELLASGELRRIEGPELSSLLDRAAQSTAGEEEPEERLDTSALEPPRGAEPLELAARFGIPDSAESAVVVRDGSLLRVSLVDGRILASVAGVVASGAQCQGVPLGDGIGFVCGEPRGRTTVHALLAGGSLSPVLELDGPRRVLPSGRGALAVHGGCDARSVRQEAVCLVRSPGNVREVEIAGASGTERVVALREGGFVLIAPPRGKSEGTITATDSTGRSTSRALSLSPASPETRELLQRGFWLDGMFDAGDGSIGGWVFDGSAFAGVHVKRDGSVVVGRRQDGAERVLVSGRFGLLRLEGAAFETTDGGLIWSDVSASGVGDDDGGGARGCTPVGCSTGGWIRIGWGASRQNLEWAPPPADAKLEPAPFVTWALSCAATGEKDGQRPVAVAPRRVRTPGLGPPRLPVPRSAQRELESSAFRPFLGVAPPVTAEGDVYFDFGTEDELVQVRGYAWGARGASWDRSGSWMLRGIDRFSVTRSVWSTAVSRPPWADAAAAAEVFGSDPSHRIVNDWSAMLDPGGEGGIVFLRTGSRTDLVVVEKDRAMVFVRNADAFPMDRPQGVVKVDGNWYLGAQVGSRSFQIFTVEAGALSRVASLPRVTDDAPARLVRSRRGDALGVWVTGRGQSGTRSGGDTWFVFPVDPRTGVASAPVVLPRGSTSHAPPPCASDRDGWLLLHEVSSSVAKLDVTNVTDPPAMHHLEARLLAGDGSLCLDALSAQVDGDPPAEITPTHSAPRSRAAPLALTDRSTDRRWGFRCTP